MLPVVAPGFAPGIPGVVVAGTKLAPHVTAQPAGAEALIASVAVLNPGAAQQSLG